MAFTLLSSFLLVLGVAGVAAAQPSTTATHANAVQDPAPSGNSGTTIDPLQYNCGNDAPTCGQVGESYGYYQGTNVDLLYSENYFCDSGVTSSASTGCEAGAGPTAHPAADTSADGTSLGNTTHADTLYIPMPLFTPAPPTQCSSTATCVDHPPTIDLSRIAGSLPGNPTPSSVENVPIPAHDHVVGTRNSGLPEWWNVQVIATTSASTFATLTSVSAITAAVNGGTALSVPTNVFLFFQVMPGTVSAAQAANLTATAPPGGALPAAPAAPPASQVESGQTIDDLTNDCEATAPNCENVGISHDWIEGQDVDALYTEPFYCDTAVSSGASSGCEAGAPPTQVPPGVSDPTPPTLTQTNSQIDPLYIPLPIYSSPPVAYSQCSAAVTCIDHPATIDLSRLASALGAPASALTNVPLPGHDHLLTTRNGDQPEWWNVIVIPVTTPAGLASVESSKSYASVQALEDVAGSGIGAEVDTNAYLWFQTLPGAGPATPGPLQTTCTSTLPSGSVVGAAAVDDGTGYYEVDSAGTVATFGAAPCYGDLTGVHLDKPIVGMAVDRATGGYWLVAADGGVFSFNAPFYGSAATYPLVKPVVGMASTLNGTGYWLVASDGGVFSYNAPFEGSAASYRLVKPVVGMAVDRATGGYWLVASDGGVFSYNAPFEGSAASFPLVKPVVGIAPVSDGSGYRLVASDGGVFAFNTPYYGSAATIALAKPVIGIMNDNSYDGYWLSASDGGVFTYSPPNEGMPFFGSAV